MIGLALSAVATAGSGLVLAHGASWTFLSLIALRRPRSSPKRQGRRESVVALVPAYNEEDSITRCVSSLRRSAALAHQPLMVLVVADNCTDETAARAREAGALVIERRDEALRGKPHALDHGLAWLAQRPAPDAVIFVDGDCEVDDEFVAAICDRLASGVDAAQGFYGAKEGGTPLQGLRRLALMLAHWSRPLGSARLGLGTTIKGSGMALRWSALKGQFGAYGLAEDAELTLHLCRRGVRVAFEPRAVVRGAMAATYEAAKTQDRRWESGRLSLVPRALSEAVRSLARGRLDLAAAALEVASLPLTLLLAIGALGVAFASVGYGPLLFAATGLASLGAYVVVGLVAARPTWRELTSLVAAPRFLVHKLVVLGELALRGGPTTWQRTDRK